MLRVSLLIQAVERVTGTVRRIRSAISGMAREGERDVGRLGRAMERMRAIARRAGAGIGGWLRAGFSSGLSGILALARRIGPSIGRTLVSGLRRTLQYGLLGITGAGSYLLYRLTAGTIATASQFEQFQVVLEGTEGSARAAQRAMGWVRNFAQTTPYEVNEVMEAFVRLRAYGINPTNGTLESLGNAASGMNKTMMDAVEMLADAQSFQFERLREFGITAQQQGNRVTFSYVRNGRSMTRQARKNAVDVQRAITGILDERFANMMRRQSLTLSGLWHNILDQVTAFQLQIANAGFFDFVKDKVAQLLARINQLAANGTLQRWAQQISRWLVMAGQRVDLFINETRWQEVANQVGGVARAFWEMARAIAACVRLVSRLNSFLGSLPQPPDFIGNIDRGLRGWVRRGLGLDPPQAPPRSGPTPQDRLLRELGTNNNAPRPSAMETLRRMWGVSARPRRAPVPSLRPGPPMRPIGATTRQGETRHRAQVDLRIRTDPGARPEVTRLTSSSRDLNVNVLRGFAGAGPA